MAVVSGNVRLATPQPLAEVEKKMTEVQAALAKQAALPKPQVGQVWLYKGQRVEIVKIRDNGIFVVRFEGQTKTFGVDVLMRVR
jgi:hypothetical protein